jgi:hypothetical protein
MQDGNDQRQRQMMGDVETRQLLPPGLGHEGGRPHAADREPLQLVGEQHE